LSLLPSKEATYTSDELTSKCHVEGTLFNPTFSELSIVIAVASALDTIPSTPCHICK
jgi:hypothetical protein